MPDGFIPAHGGYRKLFAYQRAEVVYDATVRFCERFLDRRDRTIDQMVQAARSGKQNIAEGSQASGTSKEMELKLTNVARASLEELLLDFQDLLRIRRLARADDSRPARRTRPPATPQAGQPLTSVRYDTQAPSVSLDTGGASGICCSTQVRSGAGTAESG
jgi:four helix bundle protein